MPHISADDTRSVTVYALCSSEDMRERYIGQTVETLQHRLKYHYRDANRPGRTHLHVCRWINYVLRDGHEVVIIPLQFDSVWAEDEIWWIAEYRAHGYNLTNATAGGEGMLGYVWSEESRQKVSQKMKGKKKSPEHRAAVIEAIKSRPPATAETRQRLSAAAKGKRPTNLDAIQANLVGKAKPESTREKISRTLTGRKQPPDLVARRAAAYKALSATPEHKQKRSEWCKRAWVTRKRKLLDGMEN